MKTIIGLGAALTIAVAPLAADAKPKLKIRGGHAVIQMLNGVANGNAKAIRKAARRAGLTVVVGSGAAATGGVAVARAASAPAPVFAPERVGQRPRLRPELRGFAGLDTAPATPPVTTVRDGARIETSAISTASAPAPGAVSTETAALSTGPKVVRIEGDRVSTSTVPQPLSQADGTTLAAQPIALEAGTSPFGGPTGY